MAIDCWRDWCTINLAPWPPKKRFWIIAIWKLSYDLDENWYNMDSYIVSFYIFDFCIDNIMCELTIAIVKHWSLHVSLLDQIIIV